MRHATPLTRSRCERLTDLTTGGPAVPVLSIALVLGLLHPALALGSLLLLGGIVPLTRRSPARLGGTR
ncbi:hypothetical protein [Haloplanus halobius]|uniref:hypothetical protein n=1 Tax=Haloplanus halobius TaxID=2934938 RepID=UPI0020104CCF|nr:hypothetical protein [Haloplanus sp. XH21]